MARGVRLDLVHVSRWYGEGQARIAALRDVSLVIHPGDLMAVVGPSGSGKSTLLQLLGLLDRSSEGAMSVDGREVGFLDDRALTRLRLETIGFVFQRFHLLMGQTAIENVALPLEAAGWSVGERYARAAYLLDQVGLAHRMLATPSQLSGGQRQRVAIARAIANDARLILADEPTGALHSEDKAGVVALLQAMHASGKTVVIVTHDEQIAAMCDRRLDIRDGLVSEATGRGRAT
ncbi:MAG: ABC transporter ATP-binding protein [Chloroflexi bacterium]|nr:ABC transporter ATP-binding protein [Chloroflexota bacterium]NCA13101.1 ABC transporter ATP-binding protein [Pseudomonadota bacterium]